MVDASKVMLLHIMVSDMLKRFNEVEIKFAVLKGLLENSNKEFSQKVSDILHNMAMMMSSFRTSILELQRKFSDARHIYICDYHKGVIQSARSKRKRKDSEEDSNETDTEHPEMDLSQLQVNTLRRYKRYFKVQTRPGLNKAQLSDILLKHFKALPVSEKDVISNFYFTVKTDGNKLDIKNGSDTT